MNTEWQETAQARRRDRLFRLHREWASHIFEQEGAYRLVSDRWNPRLPDERRRSEPRTDSSGRAEANLAEGRDVGIDTYREQAGAHPLDQLPIRDFATRPHEASKQPMGPQFKECEPCAL